MTIIIGIACCRKSFGETDALEHAASDTYVRAVAEIIGGIPVLIPARGGEAEVARLMQLLDGLILTGSLSNLGPGLYGGPPHPPETPEDCQRDGITLPLARAAIDAGLPVLGICRGMQELNVALGGSLHQRLQDLPDRLEHAQPLGPLEQLRHAQAHPVDIVEHGWLQGITASRRMMVNSYHYQGLDRLGEGLAIEALAADGTIEAVRMPDKEFVVGLQWHPEYDMDVNLISRRIFDSFGQAARHGRQIATSSVRAAA